MRPPGSAGGSPASGGMYAAPCWEERLRTGDAWHRPHFSALTLSIYGLIGTGRCHASLLQNITPGEVILDFLEQTAHRPYPLSKAPYVMSQVWRSLLFAHWRVPRDVLQKLIPASLEVDVFDGSAWVGVVPFRMCEVRGRLMPFHIDFLELNVRTYVKFGERHGVYFFSLDADHSLSVWGARTFYGLPYYRAKMSYENKNGVIKYSSKRLGAGSSAEFSAEYEPTGQAEIAEPGTLPYFLTERYCLLIAQGGVVYRTDIHHAPWRLAPVRASISDNTMPEPLGLTFDSAPDSLLYADEMKMVNWLPCRESP